MRSPSQSILPAVLAASVLTLGSLAHAQAPDGGPPDSDGSVPADAPMQAQLDDLLARVRQLEAERDARTAAPEVTPATADAGTVLPTPATDTAPNPFVLGGYAEALYQWNFNDPSNGITNFRGFDNRHNTFTLSNVALDAAWDHAGLVGRVTLQVGHTPSTYYLSEPSAPGASGANATGPGSTCSRPTPATASDSAADSR